MPGPAAKPSCLRSPRSSRSRRPVTAKPSSPWSPRTAARNNPGVDFRVEERFDAPVDAVEAALLDPAFVEQLSSLPKIGGAELVSQERDGDDVEQEIRYVFT